MPTPTLEQIRLRFEKIAKGHWPQNWSKAGYQDPLIDLMINGLAAELQEVYRELEHSKSEQVSHLVRQILPDSAAFAKAACGIAMPAEEIQQERVFAADHVFELRTGANASIDLSPLVETRLMPVKLMVLGTGTSLIQNGPHANISFIPGNEHASQQVWLGLKVPQGVHSLKGLKVFFHLQGASKREQRLLYSMLRKGQWSLNEKPVEVGSGLHLGIDQLVSSVEGKSAPKWGNQLFTLLDKPKAQDETEVQVAETPSLPPALKNYREDVSHWLRIEFSFPLPLNWNHLTVAVNPIVLANRALRTAQEGDFNQRWPVRALPLFLGEGEQLAGLQSVYFENLQGGNRVQHSLPSSSLTDLTTQMRGYNLRKGGMGQLDSFHTFEQLGSLLDLLRRDNPAEYDKLIKDLVDKSQGTLDLFELKNLLAVNTRPESDQVPWYLLAKGMGPNPIKTSYWITQGKEANRAYAVAQPLQSRATQFKLTMLTGLSGGSDLPQEAGLRDKARHVLLSRNKLVTRADIEHFCYAYFTDVDIAVTIKDGAGIDERPGFGLTRTLEVQITLEGDAGNERAYWQSQFLELEETLRTQYSGHLPINVNLPPPPNQDKDPKA